MQQVDIAIVGGGPAGAMCALMLARGGARVSLVHWGGYAPDGIELVSSRARRLIEQYCPDFFQTVSSGVEVRETTAQWGTPKPVTSSAMFNPWSSGVAVERPLFDHALRELARTENVSITADTKVSRIDRANDQWRLWMRGGDTASASLEADFVILATGRAAAQFLNRIPVVESSQIALMALLRPCPGDKPRHTLYVEGMDNGWWYALPARGGSYFAGFCVDRSELKKRNASLKEFFIHELRRTQLLAPLLSSDSGNLRISGRMTGIHPFSRPAGNGWIAVGDAAYMQDPLSGMGIEFAFETARLGARVLLGGMKEGATPHALAELAAYEASVRERVSGHDKAAAFQYGRLQR
ncbi:MAG: NAD(P)/FAD-dependent oxidoreductase [Nitrosospira sp.]|nr:NAD(P)/FAD-dependent oxidoreductase [Nitrosospira sp.]